MSVRIGIILAVLIAIAALLVAGATLATARSGNSTASAASAADTITTVGHGTASVVPDEATVSVGTQTSSPVARTSLSANAQDMTSVIAALHKLGIPSTAIQTADFSMYEDPQQHTYQVTHDLTVRVSANQVSDVYATTAAAGANSFGGVSYELKDPTSARDQALKAALADARHRADVEATMLGLHVTGVRSTSESPSTITTPQCTQGCGGGGGQPIQAGQVAATADVTVTYSVS